jgi:hypothetical protein
VRQGWRQVERGATRRREVGGARPDRQAVGSRHQTGHVALGRAVGVKTEEGGDH